MTAKTLKHYLKETAHFNITADTDGGTLDEWKELRYELIRDEFLEVVDALHDYDAATMSQDALGLELADLIYVVLGTCVRENIDIQYYLDQVCARNRERLAHADIVKNAAGKFIKPEDRLS